MFKAKNENVAVYGIIFLLSFILIFLSQSRGVLAGGLFSTVFFACWKYKIKWISIVKIIALLAIIFVCFCCIFPNPYILHFLLRVPSAKLHYISSYSQIMDAVKYYVLNPDVGGRAMTLPYYIDALNQSYYLGAGINYMSRFYVKWGAEIHGPNSILSILMIGGIGALAGFIYLFYILFSSWSYFRIYYLSGLLASFALLAVWLSGLIMGDHVFDYASWILIGIAYPLNLSFPLGKQTLQPAIKF